MNYSKKIKFVTRGGERFVKVRGTLSDSTIPTMENPYAEQLKMGGFTKHEEKYMKWKYQYGGSAKQIFSYLFDDDEDEEPTKQDMPTAPAADEVEEVAQQPIPEDTSGYDLAMQIAIGEEGNPYRRRERIQRGSQMSEYYPENYSSLPAANVNSSAKQAFEYYKQKGLPPHVAAGIVGNLMQESGLNPTIKGDNGLATGIAQWHPDRFKGLHSWAQASGKNPFSLTTQLDYVLQEANQRGDMAHLMNTKNSAEAAYMFAKKFERPKVIDKNRIAYAKKLN
jgi:hypothetical protein